MLISMIFPIVGCSQDDVNNSIEVTSVQAVANPSPWQLEWELATGSMNAVNVAEDGMVYGLTREEEIRHVVISSDGELLTAEKLAYGLRESSECAGDFRYRFTPFSFGMVSDGSIPCGVGGKMLTIHPNGHTSSIDFRSDFGISDPFRVKPLWYRDSFLVADSFTGKMFFVDYQGNIENILQYPNGLIGYTNSLYTAFSWFEADYDEARNEIVYFSENINNVVYRGTPDGLNGEVSKPEIRITEWGDMYVYYTEYDEQGFEIAPRVFHVRTDGSTRYLSEDPFNLLHITDIKNGEFMYIEPLEQVYYIPHNRISSYIVLDMDMNVIGEYELPIDITGKMIQRDQWFIGYDGNLYAWTDRLRKFTFDPEWDS